jgi:hypothetical protein
MHPKIDVRITDESYLFADMPRAGVELIITTGDSKTTVALDFSEASELALLLQARIREGAGV